MRILKNFQVFRQRVGDSISRRYENISNYLQTLNWLNISITLNLFSGIVFLCLGVIILASHEDNGTVGWIFFSISLCMLLVGFFLLTVRCIFPIKSARHHNHPRRHPRRPNRIYDAHSRPHRNSAQPTSAHVWTTPASDLEGQTIAQFISQLSIESAQRSPVELQAPPTYNEAIGRPENSGVQINQAVDISLPPPYQQ